MFQKLVPKNNWYVYGVVTTSVCWYMKDMVENIEMGLERSSGVYVINSKPYYRKGLRFIVEQDKFVHLFLCTSTHLLYIYIYDFRQYTKIMHKMSKNESDRKDEGEDIMELGIRLVEQTSVNLGRH